MKYLVLSVLACLLSTSSFAAKALTEWQTFTQPDGSVLVLSLCGDELFHCFIDQEGHAYLPDSLGVFHLLPPEQRTSRSLSTRRAGKIMAPTKEWNPDCIYRQIVVLVSFSDCDFKTEDPKALYDSIFNERGYNQGQGPGCVADFFRDQSEGRLNLQFDVYGPIKVDTQAKSDNPDIVNHGENVFAEAMDRLILQQPGIDFSPFDWDGDGTVEQVVFIYAGYTGNQTASHGHIWPNTGLLVFPTPDGSQMSCYSASGELWSNGRSCGIGTICHEFSHCLGLPDIYPTSNADVSYSSVVDQWDLMDGGTFTNWGWCPPNFSPFEKMLLGWHTPIELVSDTVVTNMKPVAKGGESYLISHTENEFLLLENRQWQGWDLAVPGKGLLVWHVNYDQDAWQNNVVNNTDDMPNYHVIAADGMGYPEWVALYRARGDTNTYQDKTNRLHRCIMSSAPYPWTTDSTSFVNNELTDVSVPATAMYNPNATGSYRLSKPITNITLNGDETISFTFHTSGPDGLIHSKADTISPEVYTLEGKKVHASQDSKSFPRGIYIFDKKKIIK